MRRPARLPAEGARVSRQPGQGAEEACVLGAMQPCRLHQSLLWAAAAAATAGEPTGETYGGVYQHTAESRGAAEAATYAYPTKE